MGWVLRLIETGTEDSASGTDVMEISQPRDLRNIADLGLTLVEAKQLLARVQEARGCRPSAWSCGSATGLRVLRLYVSCERPAASSDRDAVRHGDGAASPLSLR